MLSRKQISVLLVMATLIFVLVQVIDNQSFSHMEWLPFGITVSVLSLAVWVFDAYLWKVTPFKYVLNQPRPDLQGNWAVSLQSQWKKWSSDEALEPIAAFISIKQTASVLSVSCFTAESSSQSMTATLSGDILRSV